MQISDHYDGKRFSNLSGRRAKGLCDVLRWMVSRKRQPWPRHVEHTTVPPLEKPANGELAITFINHSTFLLQSAFANILTDPIFSERASPLPFVGPRRARKPGVAFADLPKVDVVLISHNHYDHMDIPTLQQLEKRDAPLFVTTLGNRSRLVSSHLSRVEEHDWWERVLVQGNLRITVTPAEHFSARGFADRNRSLWGGFFLEITGWSILFAADSGYGPHFTAIREKLGAPDVALLPIGAYLPRWFMRDIHMDPEDAVQAHLDLCATESIGMHFGTFPLSDESIEQPVNDLQRALQNRDVPPGQFRVLGFGESRVFRRPAQVTREY